MAAGEKSYDIKKISKIAHDNIERWIDIQDLGYFVNDLEKYKGNVDKAIDVFYVFLNEHIDNFFVIFTKYNKIEKDFLEENKDAIIYNIIELYAPKAKDKINDRMQNVEPGDDDPIIAQSLRKSRELMNKPKIKTYADMSQYDLKKEIDKALDNKDFDTLKKIQPYLKEGFLKYHVDEALNEAHITKSYDHPLSRDEVKQLIGKILVKFQRDKVISNMNLWLSKNNLGDYQHNRWTRAIIDTLFKKYGSTWEPINTNLSLDELTNKVMNFWQKKLSKNESMKDDDILVPRLFEGCNCGGSRKNKIFSKIMKSQNTKSNPKIVPKPTITKK